MDAFSVGILHLEEIALGVVVLTFGYAGFPLGQIDDYPCLGELVDLLLLDGLGKRQRGEGEIVGVVGFLALGEDSSDESSSRHRLSFGIDEAFIGLG